MAYDKDKTEELKAEIIDRMSKGESLKKILDNSDHLPNRTTVYRWMKQGDDYYDEAFFNNYARATTERADHLFEEILDIADYSGNDLMIDEFGKEKVNTEAIARDRLRVDARKWVIAKMIPKKYGEKLDITSDDKPLNQVPVINVQLNSSKKDFANSEDEVDA